MRIDSTALTERLGQAVQRQNSAAAGETASPEAIAEGVRVSLSALGRARAEAAKNDDIDDSGLPDNIKQMLKMIRQLKAQLAAKKAELEALMADQNLDPESRRQRAQALHGEIASLNGAISSATSNLLKAMLDQGLDPQQMQSAASLAMK